MLLWLVQQDSRRFGPGFVEDCRFFSACAGSCRIGLEQTGRLQLLIFFFAPLRLFSRRLCRVSSGGTAAIIFI